MSGPKKRHYVAAAVVVGIIGAFFALADMQYLETGRARKLTVFRALAESLQLAAAVLEDSDQAVGAALDARFKGVKHDGRVRRVFFVRKGKKIPALNISKPARITIDRNILTDDPGEEEKLITLSAKLEGHFDDGGTADELAHGTLAWRRQGNEALVVGSWPVVEDGKYAGVVGVELAPEELPASPLVPALILLASFVGLFGVLLVLLKSGSRAFAVASVVLLVALAGMLYHHNVGRAGSFAKARDTVATRVVNGVAWAKPAALRSLDSLWTRVFKERPLELEVGMSSGDGAESGAFVCRESRGTVSAMVTERTLPVILILLLTLGLGLLLLPGLASLIHGLVTQPGVYAYVAPAMVGMVVIVLVPFIMGVGLGFFNMDYEFVGLENFRDILLPTADSQTNFYYTLGVTVMWTVLNVFLHVTIGLFMALVLIGKNIRFRGLFRVLLIVPWAIPNYVTSLIWKWMFTSQIGAINLAMEAVGLEPVNWFGPSFWTNFFAVLATNAWLGFPFMMVVSLGALQSIPNELYEAADIDGATRWQKFRNVTLPLLKPALFPAVILGCIWTFNQFNIIYLVTRGQPDNKTNILITEAYRFFAELNQYGVAAAYCVLIFVILLAYTLITNRVTRATQGAFE